MSSYNTTGTTVGDYGQYRQGDNIYNTYNSSERPKTVYDVPIDILSPHFVGRDAEIQKLSQAFSNTSGHYPRRSIIYGMPGLGKTQLALRYAKYSLEELSCPYIFWISATSPDRILQGFSRVAHLLALPEHESLDQHARGLAARTWLENTSGQEKRQWLIILDNANEGTVSALRDALPRQNAHGAILITTRTHTVSEALCASSGETHLQLALDVLSGSTSILLLNRASGIQQRDLEAEELTAATAVVSSVGYLPLAIEQAGSLMKVSGCSLTAVRDIYKSDQIEEALEQEIPLSRYEQSSVMAVYDSAIQQLADGSMAATNILRLMTLMDPESIPISILQDGTGFLSEWFKTSHEGIFGEEWSKYKSATLESIKDVCETFNSVFRLSKVLTQLQTLSLVTSHHDMASRTLRIHDLTQFILRMKLLGDESVLREWLMVLEEIFAFAIGRLDSWRKPESWSQYEQFLRHVQALWERQGNSRARNPCLWKISSTLASYLSEMRRYKESAELIRKIQAQQHQCLGPEHPDTMFMTYRLAKAVRNTGDSEEAQKLYLELIEVGKQSQQSEHQAVRKALNSLSHIYMDTRQYEDAKVVVERVLEMQRRIDPPDAHLTLRCMQNLVWLYVSTGQHDRGEALSLEVWEKKRRVLGPFHDDTINTMSVLARIYTTQKRWDEAVKLDDKVVAAMDRSLSPTHPKTIRARVTRATGYMAMGKLQEATEQLEEVTRTSRALYGPHHKSTLYGLKALARVYSDQGRWDDAMTIATEVYEQWLSILGPDQPFTINAKAAMERIRNQQMSAERPGSEAEEHESEAEWQEIEVDEHESSISADVSTLSLT